MTTREKIIVGLMCLALIYGVWELFGNRSTSTVATQPMDNNLEQARSFISDLSRKVVGDKIPEEYKHIIDQAGAEWSRDPFLMQSGELKAQRESEPAAKTEKTIPATPTPAYTGYLKVGDRMLAMINGLEYAVGDSLAGEDFRVERISPQKVVLNRINGSETLTLPLQETFPE